MLKTDRETKGFTQHIPVDRVMPVHMVSVALILSLIAENYIKKTIESLQYYISMVGWKIGVLNNIFIAYNYNYLGKQYLLHFMNICKNHKSFLIYHF